MKEEQLEKDFRRAIVFDKMEYVVEIFKTKERAINFCLILSHDIKASLELTHALVNAINIAFEKIKHQQNGAEIIKQVNFSY